jgi:UDP:flavonoid glycosyltransferase YjiC (YdhE family)
LAVSAAVARVPQATLINAYFSPYAERDRWPVPDHPIVRLLGVPLAERYFPRAIPSVFAHFARPVNELRRLYGLPEIGSLLETLTYGDYTLYPDTPLLAPVRNAPRRHVYLGPVTWSPAVALPDFWNDMGRKRPCVYVTLGSSGDVRVLPIVLEGLAGLPVDVMLATARRNSNDLRLPPNVYAAEFLPGDLAARRAAFVVSNGGSATNYQALSQGTPVLGIPWNLDQYLGMACLERIGAAKSLRAGTLDAASVRQAARELLDSKAARAAAGRVAGDLSAWNATERFRRFVARVVPSQPARRFAAGAPEVSSR